MMTLTTALGIAASSLFIGLAQAPVSTGTVATAGAITVTVEEIVDVIREARKGDDLQRLAASLSLDGLEAFASDLLERKVLAAEARARALDREAETSRIITTAVDGILADTIVAREREAADTSSAALRRFYTEHGDRFRTRPRRKARHIVVASREDADAALAELRAGRDFAETASARNTDSTRATGGELGWVPRNLMVKEFEDAVFALAAGATSEPVRTVAGWHIVKVEEIDPGSLAPFDLLEAKVAEAVRDDAVARLKAGLWRRTPAAIDRAALAALLK